METSNKQVPVLMLRDYYDAARGVGIPAPTNGEKKIVMVDEMLATQMVASGFAEMWESQGDKPDSKCVSLQGPPGDPGPPGRNGTPGRNGSKGADGVPGTNGKDGQNGQPGPPGPRGHAGCDGPKGDPGCDGKDGAPGKKGEDGANGKNGTPGARGPIGQPGPQGDPGDSVKGDPGPAGPPGAKGDPGGNGSPGTPGVSPVIRATKNADNCLVVTTSLNGTVLDECTLCSDGVIQPPSEPCIEVVKTCDAGPYAVGDTVTFTNTVRNCGNVALTDVVLSGDCTFADPNIGTLAVGGMVAVECTTVVTQAQADAGDSFDCSVSVTGNDPTGAPVTDDDTHTVPLGTERQTKIVCGKVIAPVFDFEPPSPNPPRQGLSNNDDFVFNSNGVEVRMNYTGLIQGQNETGQPDHCILLDNVTSGQSLSVSVTGLSAYAVGNCEPCLSVCPEIGSLDAGTGFNTGAAYPVGEIVSTDQNSATQFTGQGAGDGHVIFDMEVNSDGVFFEVPSFFGTPDTTRFCLQKFRLQRAVEVTCYADNNEFISATDSDGNTYTESEIQLT